MKHFLRLALVLTVVCFSYSAVFSQFIKKALFLGNSYTQVNDLPQMISNIAHSAGDSLYVDSNTPGGCTFQLHSTNSISLSKIVSNNWDYIVLQEQSQLPSFSPAQVQTDVYPYADSLIKKIRANDTCTKPLFYMTWGRKNGDQTNCSSYPPVCTYLGMQQRLKDSYIEMGNMFDAEVCPAGIAWKHLRKSNPAIELYQTDESHPTLYGTYLVACTFYSAIFHKSPIGLFIPAGITTAIADTIQRTAYFAVFDSLNTWNIDTAEVNSCFTYNHISGSQYQFNNCSHNAISYFWQFGDGATSFDFSPSHLYNSAGNYHVVLTVNDGCRYDSLKINIDVVAGIYEQEKSTTINLFPIPAEDYLNIESFDGVDNFDQAEIYNSIGGLITKLKITDNRIFINSLSSGYYSVRLISEKGSRILSFIKR